MGNFFIFSGKKKLLLLKTDKTPPAGKSCRFPPKCVLMQQSYLCFFAARTFFSAA
jgi:hypothetical protein